MKLSRLNRFQIRRLRSLRRLQRRTWLLVGGGVAALLIVAILPIATGRTTPRWYRLQAAKLAARGAQDAGADDWAPDALGAAEAMLRLALIEHRHQELRILPLRDFTQAELLLRDAEAKAHRAANLALDRRQNARGQSQEDISRAAQAVGRSVNYSTTMNLGRYDRMLLTKSKLRLEEAELLQKYGKFDLASDRAHDANSHADQVADHAAQAAARYRDAGLIRSWRQDIDETIGWSSRSGAAAIVVYKEKHQLVLYHRGKQLKTYSAELGYNSIGDKARSGDAATPEGRYHIAAKKPVGQSGYHMALLLDYPNSEDRRRFDAGKRTGRIARNASLGGLIEIHGEGGRGKDWTKGCVALSNGDMEDLFLHVGVGTPVTIVGGDGNGGSFTKLVEMHKAGTEAGTD